MGEGTAIPKGFTHIYGKSVSIIMGTNCSPALEQAHIYVPKYNQLPGEYTCPTQLRPLFWHLCVLETRGWRLCGAMVRSAYLVEGGEVSERRPRATWLMLQQLGLLSRSASEKLGPVPVATGADGGHTDESFSVPALLKLIIHRYSLTLRHSDKFSHIPHPRCDEAVLETQVTCTRRVRIIRSKGEEICDFVCGATSARQRLLIASITGKYSY